MKRGLLLSLFLLFCIKSTNAQLADILGDDLSILVLLPLVLIIIVAIAFIITLIMDNTRNFYSKKPTTPGMQNVAQEIKKDIEEPKEAPKPWINYLDVMNTFTKRLGERDTNEAFNILIRIIKEFFKDRLKLNYEFTFDELLKELDKRHFFNKEIIHQIIDLSYKGKKIDKKIVYYVATKFREIVKIVDKKKLYELEQFNVNKNLKFDRLKRIMQSVQSKEGKLDEGINKFIGTEKSRLLHFQLKKKTEPEVKRDFEDFDKDKVEQISFLINKGKEALNKNNINGLRNTYSDICYLFPFLSDKSKKVAYLEILEFYENINKKLFPEMFKTK